MNKGKEYIYVPSCSSYVAGGRSGLNTEHGALDAKAQAHARFPFIEGLGALGAAW